MKTWRVNYTFNFNSRRIMSINVTAKNYDQAYDFAKNILKKRHAYFKIESVEEVIEGAGSGSMGLGDGGSGH